MRHHKPAPSIPARIQRTIKEIVDALKDPPAPEVEIGCLEELEVFIGETMIFTDIEAGYDPKNQIDRDGTSIKAKVINVTDSYANLKVVGTDVDVVITNETFEKGLRAYPVRE